LVLADDEQSREELQRRHRAHRLTGDWSGILECRIDTAPMACRYGALLPARRTSCVRAAMMYCFSNSNDESVPKQRISLTACDL
jgi:hypothetical protein